jgi:hypothetical protein
VNIWLTLTTCVRIIEVYFCKMCVCVCVCVCVWKRERERERNS